MTKPLLSYAVVPSVAFVLGVGCAAIFAGPATALTVAILAILEVSLSFDNATVNATVLQNWDERWRGLFIWIGLPIAVFGMRLAFPALIVSVAAHVSPLAAARLALFDPATYARDLGSAHSVIEAFGGAFLAALGFRYFIDAEKERNWIPVLESVLSRCAVVPLLDAALTLALLLVVDRFVSPSDRLSFLTASLVGIVVFVASRAAGVVASHGKKVVAAGIGGLLYLEILDGSFSFDGVLGAFALTNQVVWIAVGLGIGALSVRELTLLAVDRGALVEYPYLENGAFWSILLLAVLMLISPIVDVPQYVTGLLGAALILAAFVTSLVHNRRTLAETVDGATP